MIVIHGNNETDLKHDLVLKLTGQKLINPVRKDKLAQVDRQWTDVRVQSVSINMIFPCKNINSY